VFDAAYAEGGELTLHEAATLAFAVDHPDLAADSSRFAVAAGDAQIPEARQHRGPFVSDTFRDALDRWEEV
jgi:hypothetical protein